jgi:hypothetical protein
MFLILKATQEKIKASIDVLDFGDLKLLTKDWAFEWDKEYNTADNFVYKVVTTNNNVIHGLISFRKNSDHIYANLLEVSQINKGKSKAYENVAGILFAFVCQQAFVYGYDGFVVFESKTLLKHHYSNVYGAKTLMGNKMYFDTLESKQLINKFLS